MKFSVLLNNYNYGRFVGAAIESVLGQTHGDFELIIVDDGSTDDSREIIARYEDSRIVTVFKANGGQASAFNAGFMRASADYIAFLDADDLWDAPKLERCEVALRAAPETVLLNHAYRSVDAKGKTFGEPSRLSHWGRYELLPDLRRLETNLPLVPTSFFIGRRKQCIALRLDEKSWRIAADKPVVTGLGLRGPIYNLDEVLGSYRCHGANDSHGRFNDDLLFEHHQRFYAAANAECHRLGLTDHFEFLDAPFATGYRICRTSRYSPLGVYLRLKRLLQKSKYK
jgi:glycosyltransferase involved in cell wall biosynthesis